MVKSMMSLEVIVPVFNTPVQDLERCLNSIQAQSYKEWSCLIVDASSDPETSKFIVNFCKINEKFRFVKTENKGAAGNRNVALEQCKAEFITFVDADDEVTPNFIEKSLEFIKDDSAVDIVMGATAEIKKTSVRKTPVLTLRKPIAITDNLDKSKLLSYLVAGIPDKDTNYLNGILVGRVYPKIIRTSLAKIVSFNENITIHEDNIFSFKTFELAKKIVITPEVFYLYYKNDYSVTNSLQNYYSEFDNCDNELKFSKQLLDIVKSSNYKIKTSAIGIRLTNNVMNYIYSIKNSESANVKVNVLLNSEMFNEIPKANYATYFGIGIKKKMFLKANPFFRGCIIKLIITLVRIKKILLKSNAR